MSDAYDVIVIGAGPAGYPAAIRAGQNKLKVACIDEWKNFDGTYAFGGTCLNAGCIPSKALLESSELFQRAKDEFAVHGIKLGDIKLDLAAMQKRRASIVKTMTNGINALFKSAGVTGIQGHGQLLPGNKVLVTTADGSQKTLEAKHVVLATARPSSILGTRWNLMPCRRGSASSERVSSVSNWAACGAAWGAK
jgi:dihydrolipoamide dehydrogenase